MTIVQPFVHLSRPSHALPAPRWGKSSKKRAPKPCKTKKGPRACFCKVLVLFLVSCSPWVPGPTFTHAAAPLRVSHFTCRRRHRCADPPVGVVLPSTTACGLMVNCMPRPPKRCTKTGFCALVLREFWTQLLSGALIARHSPRAHESTAAAQASCCSALPTCRQPGGSQCLRRDAARRRRQCAGGNTALQFESGHSPIVDLDH